MSAIPPSQPANPALEIFAGNSEMGARMRQLDWSKTPLGPVEFWPQSLKTVVRILLSSRYAMWMAWGSELTFFCNDAYLPTLGVKETWALGSTARDVWAEIWPDIGPRIDKVLLTAEATWDEALPLFLERSGYPEETYHTFSYSPLADDSGTTSGMLCVVTEETERIINERRMALLRDVGTALASAQTTNEVVGAMASCLDYESRDLPFTLTYLLENDKKDARLVRTTGIAPDHSLAISSIQIDDPASPWPLAHILSQQQPTLVDDLTALCEPLPAGPWDKPSYQALIAPIAYKGAGGTAGFLISGVNPYRKLDSDYLGFMNLLVGQLASSLENARAYEEERRRAEALEELDRAKTAFFSNVSHEFRTPLTLMLGPLEDAVGENRVLEGDTLQTVHRNSLRLLKLVNTLLDFSRIEAGRVQASYQSVDLAECTAELASVFRSAVEKAGMKLIVSCEPLSEPAYVDRDMWEKVVLNLLSNAFKFTLEGEIEVRLHQDRNRAFLTVRDTGTGISAEQLPHIFERFHRVEGTRARTHEGTGIGLALVQELVRLHGGSIDVESAPEVGTTFTIGLPLGKSHLPADRISATVSLSSTALRADAFVEEVLRWIPGAGDSDVQSFDVPVAPMPHDNGGIEAKRSHILLADDNADMREYVQRLLQSHYEVTAVSNGVEALKALAAQSPDLVLSDVMMPELDGFGLLQSIRGDLNTSRIPVILLSARAGEEARIEGLAAGADDYLTKPFTARDLLSRVASHLELARVRYEGEQALRESEERFRTMADTAPVLIWMAGVDTLCTYFNRPWLEFTGRSLEAEIGTGWAEGVHSDDVQQCWNTYLPAFEARKEFRIEFRLRSHSGEYRWMLGSGVPRYSPDGTFSGYIGSCMDITDRKAAEAERDRHLAEIESLNVRLQRGMTETHHRVKNNLQLMSALIDMQRTTGAETVPMSELTRLAANVRALGVIHDVLTHEVKAGSDQETLPVNTVLARLVELLDQTADRRTLIAHFDELRLAARQATTLALVTNELISNALKHGNGEVEVHLRICDDAAMLEVCDDGPGFPQDFKFETMTNTGLELVKDIVVWDLAGKIDHNNRATGGARVVVTFPITPNEGEA